MPRVLITGATGFLGSHVTRHLVGNGCQVAILTRPQSNPWRIQELLPSLYRISADLGSVNQVADQILDFAPEAIIHLAWQGAGSYRYQNDPEQVFENLHGSLDLVHLASKCNCRTWIGMGSVIECGHYPVPVREDLEPRPVTLYGVAKHGVRILAEKLCQVYGIRFGWFRVFWTFGPLDDAARMIPFVISTLVQGQKPALTAGEQVWDYLYVQDAVDAICKLALESNAHGMYNLGSGQAYPIRTIVERIRDLIDPSLPLGFGEIPYRPDQIMYLQADISKLRQAIGWEPTTSLDEGLQRTIAWHRSRNEQG